MKKKKRAKIAHSIIDIAVEGLIAVVVLAIITWAFYIY